MTSYRKFVKIYNEAKDELAPRTIVDAVVDDGKKFSDMLEPLILKDGKPTPGSANMVLSGDFHASLTDASRGFVCGDLNGSDGTEMTPVRMGAFVSMLAGNIAFSTIDVIMSNSWEG